MLANAYPLLRLLREVTKNYEIDENYDESQIVLYSGTISLLTLILLVLLSL